MQLVARVLSEPAPHLGGLVSPVVVHDQMNVLLFGQSFFQQTQEAQELLMPMTTVTRANHLSGCDIEGREQGSSAMAQIVMVCLSTMPGRMGSSGWVRSSA